MSLENNFKRIADSLEIIAACYSNPIVTTPPPADVSPSVAPVAPPAAPVTYTPEEVNGILLKEAQRLKGPAEIHAEMKRLGVTGVQSATAEQITALITAVQAIES